MRDRQAHGEWTLAAPHLICTSTSGSSSNCLRADHSTRILPAREAPRVDRSPRLHHHACSTDLRAPGTRRLHSVTLTRGRAQPCLHSRVGFKRGEWKKRRLTYEWARQDSNLRPTGYEPAALTPELRALLLILSQLRLSARREARDSCALFICSARLSMKCRDLTRAPRATNPLREHWHAPGITCGELAQSCDFL